MKISLYVIPLLICLVQCCEQKQGDPLFQKEFTDNLLFFEKCFLADTSDFGNPIDAQKVKDMIMYLEVITNIRANDFDFEHLAFYGNAHQKSFNKWEKWYKKNRFIVTKLSTDSLLQESKNELIMRDQSCNF